MGWVGGSREAITIRRTLRSRKCATACLKGLRISAHILFAILRKSSNICEIQAAGGAAGCANLDTSCDPDFDRFSEDQSVPEAQ